MKRNKIDLALIGILLIIGLAFTGCPDDPDPSPGPGDTFVAVTGITGVPTAATAGTPLTLTGTVAPADATNKAITWSVANAGTTGATISGSTFNATAAGTATVTATIANGATVTMPFTQDFTITVTAPAPRTATYTGTMGNVTYQLVITEGAATPGTGTFTPSQGDKFVLTVGSKTSSGAVTSFTGGVFTLTPEGVTETFTATVEGVGLSKLEGTITYDDDSTETAPGDLTPAIFVAVTSITGVPTTATVGIGLTLTGTVQPANASNQTIVWSGTGVSNGVLTAAAEGTITVTATIANGATETTPYTQTFDITVTAEAVFVPVTGITGVPSEILRGTTLPLTGTVQPSNADNKDIVWTISSLLPPVTPGWDETWATITDNTLTVFANRNIPATVTVIATIANGKAEGEAYTEVFQIDVLQTIDTALTNFVNPITGNIPDTMISNNFSYDGTVTWEPEVDEVFLGSTVYTATITLTPKTNYTLQGVEENAFTMWTAPQGTTITNAANSGVVTAVFPATAVATVSSIAITAPPTKTVYLFGEELDIDGLEVTVAYNDRTTAPLNIEALTVSGYNSQTLGEQTVTLTYTAGTTNRATTFTVTVIVRTPTADDFVIGSLTRMLEGFEGVTITARDGKSSGATTVYYDGGTDLPAEAGTYAITFDVAESTGWSEAEGFEGGILTLIDGGETTLVFYWVNEQDELATSSAQTIRRWERVTITTTENGYTGQRWFVNGIEDTARAGQTAYTFLGSRGIIGTSFVGLMVEKDGQPYYAEFAITVTN